MARSYGNLGNVYRIQGQYERALENHQKALEIFIKVSGQDHLDVASSYSNIEVVNGRQGKCEEAFHLLEKSLDMRIKLVGFKRPDVVNSYVNLAWIIKQGNESKCQAHLQRAFETGFLWRALSFLENEDDFSAVRSAAWFQDLLQNAKKEESKVHSLRNAQRLTTVNSDTDVAKSYNVAVIYQEQGKHEEALEMHTTSLDIMTRILGGDNPPRCSGEQVQYR